MGKHLLAVAIILAMFVLSTEGAELLVINEIDYDQPGIDTAEFIELKNVGDSSINLAGFQVVFINGKDGAAYQTIDLPTVDLAPNAYFVICSNAAHVAECDHEVQPEINLIQNGAPDAVALIQGETIIDAVSYEGDTATPYTEDSGQGLEDSPVAFSKSISRCADGKDSNLNSSDFLHVDSTPGTANACVVTRVQLGNCGDPATLIHVIQGNDLSSPIARMEGVIVEGVVVGDFQDVNTELRGFFMQEEDEQADADPLTSEGIFIFDDGSLNVNEGDVVRLRGEIIEFNGLTELKLAEGQVCPYDLQVTPTPINLPLAALEDYERYEGMLVTFPQRLTVTEVFTLGRFGSVTLSQGGRLFQPTNIVAPGSAANALEAANQLSRLIVDDASSIQNPDPIIYPVPGLGAFNTLRNGDSIDDITGVLGYAFDQYTLYPTVTPVFVPTNPRTAVPEPLEGTLRVASFNVLNYFNGNGQGGGFPTSRGADSVAEFERQRDKIIQAILALEADVIGLMEIENDGYDANSAIQDLIDGLNASAPSGTTYAFIDPGFGLGTDQIKVGILYRAETVKPIDAAATTTTAPFGSRRPPLAQTFEEISSKERLTIVVNHFKSKGCRGAFNLNADQGDGQGCWNAERVQAAKTLAEWLATDPTSSNDPDILIMGDLNAYGKEDPITAIVDAGYTNLIEAFVGPSAYSFVFMGQSGYLDHALASASLTAQVTGVAEWHINADEPPVLDYNLEFKTVNQSFSLYNDDPYRSSDHDPVIVGLTLGNDEAQTSVTPNDVARYHSSVVYSLPLLVLVGMLSLVWKKLRRET